MPPEGEPNIRCLARCEVWPDEIVDLPPRGASLQPIDDPAALEHEQRGHLAHPEMLRELRAAVGVEVDDPKALLLRHFDPRDEALHLPRDSALSCAHEDERRGRWSALRRDDGWDVEPAHVLGLPTPPCLETGGAARLPPGRPGKGTCFEH